MTDVLQRQREATYEANAKMQRVDEQLRRRAQDDLEASGGKPSALTPAAEDGLA
ncbi:hypothetical protein ACQKFX_21320 [Cupriavidus metallidurans]|uniref:hypothetical protein n=1 Tax=Cupriavidus metallidurans TaxID=119219 RepID=UPI003D06198B